MKRENLVSGLALGFAVIAAVPWVLWIRAFEANSTPEHRLRAFLSFFPSPLKNVRMVTGLDVAAIVIALSLGVVGLKSRSWSRAAAAFALVLSSFLLILSIFQTL